MPWKIFDGAIILEDKNKIHEKWAKSYGGVYSGILGGYTWDFTNPNRNIISGLVFRRE